MESCAATGATTNLTHVSPRSGRAVSAEAAAPYADRMLKLPAFLVPGRGAPESPMSHSGVNDSLQAVLDGLALTGHFLENRLFAQLHAVVPQAAHGCLKSCEARPKSSKTDRSGVESAS